MSRTPAKLLAIAAASRKRGSLTPQWLAAAINEHTGHILSLRMLAADGITIVEERAIICTGGFVEAWNFRGACTQWPVDAFVRHHFASVTDTSDDDVVRAILSTAEIRRPDDFPSAAPQKRIAAIMPGPRLFPQPQEPYGTDHIDDNGGDDDEMSEAELTCAGISFTIGTPPIDHASAASKVYAWLRSTAITPPVFEEYDHPSEWHQFE